MQKTSRQRTAGSTISTKTLFPPPPLTSPVVKQLHSLDEGIGIFHQRYGITHVGGDAVASAIFGKMLPPPRSSVTKQAMVQKWLA